MKKLTEVSEYLEKSAGILSSVAENLARNWRPITIGGGVLGAGLLGAHALGIAGGIEGDQQGKTLSYRINRSLNTLFDRVQADEAAGAAFAKQIGSETGKAVVGLTQDMLAKTLEGVKDRLQVSPVRQAIFADLKAEDPILQEADNKTLLEAYHTMAKVAPTLATDKNAVRSFLTQAVTSGGGLDFQTIKGIADAEGAVRKAHE